MNETLADVLGGIVGLWVLLWPVISIFLLGGIANWAIKNIAVDVARAIDKDLNGPNSKSSRRQN